MGRYAANSHNPSPGDRGTHPSPGSRVIREAVDPVGDWPYRVERYHTA